MPESGYYFQYGSFKRLSDRLIYILETILGQKEDNRPKLIIQSYCWRSSIEWNYCAWSSRAFKNLTWYSIKLFYFSECFWHAHLTLTNKLTFPAYDVNIFHALEKVPGATTIFLKIRFRLKWIENIKNLKSGKATIYRLKTLIFCACFVQSPPGSN